MTLTKSFFGRSIKHDDVDSALVSANIAFNSWRTSKGRDEEIKQIVTSGYTIVTPYTKSVERSHQTVIKHKIEHVFVITVLY